MKLTMSKNTNNTSESKFGEDPFNDININDCGTSEVAGLYYISLILQKFHELIKSKNNSYSSYIYRGVSKLYDPKNCIRSGAAVRLSYTNPEFTYSNYISYIQNLVAEAKHNFPSKYESYSDLEILSDLQHNGAATCLVDFSKNILISLWFACGETQENDENKTKNETQETTRKELQENDGVLYCYDYMNDAVERQQLNIIKPSEVECTIQDLLRATQPLSKYADMLDYSFSFWNPSVVNNRIVRQDSVFVFGLPQFKVAEHDIICIQIRNEFKASIRKALTSYFNISDITIFNDSHGYASVSHKLAGMDWSRDNYYLGLKELFAGNYQLALDYFLRKELDSSEDNIFNAELHLSIAICYKNILESLKNDSKENRSISVTNAKYEYLKAIDQYKEEINTYKKNIINTNEQNEADKIAILFDRYVKKLMRTYTRLIDILWEKELYNDCLIFAKKQLDDVKKYNESINEILCKWPHLKAQESKELTTSQKTSKAIVLQRYNASIIETSIIELKLLLLLNGTSEDDNLNDGISPKSEDENSTTENLYAALLIKIFTALNKAYLDSTKPSSEQSIGQSKQETCYYKLIDNLMSKEEQSQNGNIEKSFVDKYFKGLDECDVPFLWDFDVLNKAINKNDKLSEEDKEKITNLIALLSQQTDRLQVQRLNRN